MNYKSNKLPPGASGGAVVGTKEHATKLWILQSRTVVSKKYPGGHVNTDRILFTQPFVLMNLICCKTKRMKYFEFTVVLGATVWHQSIFKISIASLQMFFNVYNFFSFFRVLLCPDLPVCLFKTLHSVRLLIRIDA
jgi:hypothetical protein